MNKTLKILGGVFLSLVILVAIGAMIIVPKWRSLGKEALAYIEANLPAIVESWNPKELEKRADPKLLSTTSTGDIAKIFGWFSTLGKLRKLEMPTGQLWWGDYEDLKEGGIWADCIVQAEFDRGPADIRVVLHRSGDTWQIRVFTLKSLALLPKSN